MLAGAVLLVMAVTSSQLDSEAKSRAWCAVHRNDDRSTRASCADRAWCGTHWNDDEVSRIACEPWRSHANLRLPAPNVTRASLASARNLNESEKRSECGGPCFSIIPVGEKPPPPDWSLLPGGIRDARLAMRADLSFHTVGDMTVKIGVAPDGGGVIFVDSRRWNVPRRTVTARLTDAEVDRVLAALGKSRFWQLPQDTNRQYGPGPLLATIEVSVPGRRHHVTDPVPPYPDSVDLAVLANTITSIVFARWKGI